MKTQGQAIDMKVFVVALKATSERRASLIAFREKDQILRTIQSDTVMRQRWERYCKENYYANGIPFDGVIEVLLGIAQITQ